jgi:hypothetical protein
MIRQWPQSLLHAFLRVQVAQDDEEEEEEEDGTDDGPFDCVGGLLMKSNLVSDQVRVIGYLALGWLRQDRKGVVS